MVAEKLHTPEERIIYFIDLLKESGQVRYKEEVYEATGIIRQYYNSVKKGEKRFTTNHIQALCKEYKINANWIFGVEENMFRD